MRSIRIACIACVLLLAVAPCVNAQVLRGRVVESEQRRPLADVTVRLLRGDSAVAEAGTDRQGYFQFEVAPGQYRVQAQRLGYTAAEQAVTVREGLREVLVPAMLLSSQAVRIESIEATARPEQRRGALDIPVASPANRITGARLHKLEQMGATPYAAIRELAAGVRIRTYVPPAGPPQTCVESTRRISFSAGGPCQNVAVILDGVHIGDASFLKGVSLVDYESIEFLSGLEAGVRYGMEASSRGALMLWTRGGGPHRSAARNGDPDGA